MRNKRVEFPQRLSDIYADAPKFLNGLLQDIRRLDATWVTHNDNMQTKMPQVQHQHQKAMITFITNMLGVDVKDQHLLPGPTTFATFKDEKGPCTYCKQDTHTWEQYRNRTQDHQLKKDVGSLHVLLNEQNRLLTKIVEKKVESKEVQEILAKKIFRPCIDSQLVVEKFKELRFRRLILQVHHNRRVLENSKLLKKTEMWAISKAKGNSIIRPNFNLRLM
jgi:hypothetical protein